MQALLTGATTPILEPSHDFDVIGVHHNYVLHVYQQVRGLEESNLGMILGMYSSPSAKQLLNRTQRSNEAGAHAALAATDDGADQPS